MLSALRGFVFDLDGCVWTGNVLSPGARDVLARFDRAGRRLAFITNNSRETGARIRARLARLGVTAGVAFLTPLEIIGEAIRERYGASRVLVLGSTELADVIRAAKHEIVGVGEYGRATVVVVGNDFDLTYERLTAAVRAAARGAALVTPNLDPRLPIEGGEFFPGCGAIVTAVQVASGTTPVVIGKPESPLFTIALRRLALEPHDVAMVGDSVPSDIEGGRRVGMRTVLYAPHGADDKGPADTVVRSFAELAELAGV
jgi:HAD superfamily hydrolase (TIGR01450 family)